MIRLFRSSLYRALKSKIFFACLIVNAAVALIGCLYQAYSLRPSGYEVSALGIFYSGFGGGNDGERHRQGAFSHAGNIVDRQNSHDCTSYRFLFAIIDFSGVFVNKIRIAAI